MQGMHAINPAASSSTKGQGSRRGRGAGRGGRGTGRGGRGTTAPAVSASPKASPSDKWCKDWQEWVAAHADDSAASFNAVGEAANACNARLSQHQTVSAAAAQLQRQGSGSSANLLRRATSAESDVLSAASMHTASVRELAAAQLDRQALSLRSNTRKSEDAAGASAIVRNHGAALDLLMTAAASGAAPLSVELMLRVHRTLMGDAPHAGELRTSTRALIGSVVFAPAAKCAELLASFVAAINKLCQRADISHLGLAAAASVGLLSIHPFHDGNGRLSRLLANAMLRRRGVPFVVGMCGTDDQRKTYVAAITASREGRGSMVPFANLLAEHVGRAWEELDRRNARAKAARDEAAEAQLMRACRERARQEGCMICLEQGCNMLTLCCGAACHMNCMAQWLAEAATPTCCACREPLPRPPPRPPPPAVPAPAPAPAAQAAADDDTTEDTTFDDTTIDDDTTTFDETTTDDTTTEDDAVDAQLFVGQLKSLVDSWQQAPSGSDAEAAWVRAIVEVVRENAHHLALAKQTLANSRALVSQVNAAAAETLVELPAPDPDDTTTEDDTTTDDTTTDATPRTDARGRPVCRHCTNQPAPSCPNACCGRCCVLHGQFHCARHRA